MPPVLAALVALLLPALAAAQGPQTPVFRTGVEVIPIDVTVTDRNGRQVTDLTAGDFQVEVDGRTRRVISAEYVPLVDARADAGALAAPEPAVSYATSNVTAGQHGRLIMVLVDQGNIRIGAARSVMASAVKFLDRLAPADRVAVVAIPGPGVLVDFTTEHFRAREALLRIAGLYSPFKKRFNISLTEAFAVTQNRDARIIQTLILRECGAFLGTSEAERCEREVEQEAAELMFHQRDQTSNSIRGMREVFRSLRAVDTPKSVILVSEGLVLDGLGGEIDELAAMAADARASLDVLLLDVPLFDASQAQLPPTAREDRDLRELGLEMLSGMARGGLYRIATTADYAFDRIQHAMAGYYLLGLEAGPSDRDGRRHQIRVRSPRRNLTIYSRRGFLAPSGPAVTSADEAVARALRAPLTMTDMPLRLSTWTYKEAGTARVRLLFAVEIERTTDQPLDYMTGLAVIDTTDGQAVAASVETRTLAVDRGDAGLATYAGALTLDPGVYRVRFAAADHEGRVGSVDREVQAWHMGDEDLALGDLLLAPAPDDDRTSLAPMVEPRVHNHQLVALTEIYGTSESRLDSLQARLDVVRDETSAPIASLPMQLGLGDTAEVRTAQAHLDTSALPPGRYLARVTVSEGGMPRGDLVRPFRVMPRGATALPVAGRGGAREVHAALIASLPPFERDEVLIPAVLESVWQATAEGRSPEVQAAVNDARQGRYGAGAMAAFEAGDQMVAAFLRGVELFTSGQLPQAAVQLQNAMGMAPSFAPARLFLGASLAAASRHREAAGLFTSVPSTSLAAPAIGRLAGDAWLRAGEAPHAIAPLQRAAAPGDDLRAVRALGLAYIVTDAFDDGLPLLARYLEAHPDDEWALLGALYGVYARHLDSAAPPSADDRARAAQWARAYRAAGGAMAGLVDAWMDYMDR
ncbi:MAG: VWA domain-containing protein [Vicinamibacterales bacterium]|nr:VWA domain-containing protein [Vicinamibacterales bacterium]